MKQIRHYIITVEKVEGLKRGRKKEDIIYYLRVLHDNLVMATRSCIPQVPVLRKVYRQCPSEVRQRWWCLWQILKRMRVLNEVIASGSHLEATSKPHQIKKCGSDTCMDIILQHCTHDNSLMIALFVYPYEICVYIICNVSTCLKIGYREWLRYQL